MDFYSNIVHDISKFWYLLFPVAVLLVLLIVPRIVCCFHEPIISFFACMRLGKKKYHRIHDVILPSENGCIWIDHILVSVFGIFVIEKMNMKGAIYGDAGQKTWIQKIHKKNNLFQNPIHRNCKNVKILQSVLELKDNQIHPVVVFVGDSTFKTPMPENVTRGMELIKFIKSRKKPVLTEFDVMEIKLKIIDARLEQSIEANRVHVTHTGNIQRKKEKGEAPSCPECGNSMMLRKVKKGPNAGKKIWSCKKFPDCRGIAPLRRRAAA